MQRDDAPGQVAPAHLLPPGDLQILGQRRLIRPRANRFGEVDVGVGVGGCLARNRRQRPHQVGAVDLAEWTPSRVGELTNDDAPARTGYPKHLLQARLPVGHVPQPEGDRHGIEGGVSERQSQSIACHEGHPRVTPPTDGQHPLGEIAGNDERPCRRDRFARGSGSSREVQHPVAGQRTESFSHLSPPPAGLTKGQDVIGAVVSRGDVVEHRRDVLWGLVQSRSRHARIVAEDKHHRSPYPDQVHRTQPETTAPKLIATTRPIADVDDLLAALPRIGGLCWMRRGEGLVGWGIAAKLQVRGVERFSRAQRWWTELCDRFMIEDSVSVPGTGPIAFASFAFDPDDPSELIVPKVLIGQRSGQTWVTTIHTEGKEPPDSTWSADVVGEPTAVTWKDGALSAPEWEKAVARAVDRIAGGELDKVVLARDVIATIDGDLDPRLMLQRLAVDYPTCWTFQVAGLLGATPELLVRRTGDLVTSRVLAGTVRRRGDSQQDEGLAQALLASDRDLAEHAYAVKSVAKALATHCTDMDIPEKPTVLELTNVQHLATDVTGRLADDASILTLAASLHPTAAVCGTPTERALAMIADLEEMSRGRYAGPVGWFDARGDGEFGIALRCAELDVEAGTVRAFAGCGIVAGSDPERELAESRAKLVPILAALDN